MLNDSNKIIMYVFKNGLVNYSTLFDNSIDLLNNF